MLKYSKNVVVNVLHEEGCLSMIVDLVKAFAKVNRLELWIFCITMKF